MENLREIVVPALKAKGITINKMCSDLGITEQGLYRSFRENTIRHSTYNKIKEYLDIQSEAQINISSNDDSYWKSKYEESQKIIKTLLNTIEVMSLGKHSSVPYSQLLS